MLVVTRKLGQRIYVTLQDGTKIAVQVVGFKGGAVRLGIDAPAHCHIERDDAEGSNPMERAEAFARSKQRTAG